MVMVDGGDVASEISRIPSGERVNCADTTAKEKKKKVTKRKKQVRIIFSLF